MNSHYQDQQHSNSMDNEGGYPDKHYDLNYTYFQPCYSFNRSEFPYINSNIQECPYSYKDNTGTQNLSTNLTLPIPLNTNTDASITNIMKRKCDRDDTKIVRIPKINNNYQDFQNMFKFAWVEDAPEESHLLIRITEYRNLISNKRQEFNKICKEKFSIDLNSTNLLEGEELPNSKKIKIDENKKTKTSCKSSRNHKMYSNKDSLKIFGKSTQFNLDKSPKTIVSNGINYIIKEENILRISISMKNV